MNATTAKPAEQSRDSAATAWRRALELTAPIPHHPERILPTVIEELAAELGEKPAVLSDRECLTYGTLAERSNQYARWALDRGLAKGDCVCLFMPNRPEYLAVWLGITKVGGVVALLNTHLAGASLARSINIVAPKHVIAAAELVDRLITAIPDLTVAPTIWSHGDNHAALPRINRDIERYSGEMLDRQEHRPPTIDDRALYIYTSGPPACPRRPTSATVVSCNGATGLPA